MLASSLSGAGGAAGGWLPRSLAGFAYRRIPLYATLRGSHVDVGCDTNRCTLDAAREPRNLFFGRSFGTEHRDEKERALREGTGSAGGGSLAHHRGSFAPAADCFRQAGRQAGKAGEVDAS